MKIETYILRGGRYEKAKIYKPFLNAGLEDGDETYSDGTIKRKGKIIVKGNKKRENG